MKTSTLARLLTMALIVREANTGENAAEGSVADPTAVGEATVKKEPVLANIIRGRMPVGVVYIVRFGDNKNEASKDLAKMFGTTIGKIEDIKKDRNFGYVKADFKPTQAQKDEAIAWLQRHPEFDQGKADKLINEVTALEVANEQEAATFLAARVAARGTSVTTKTGEIADGGGGNNIKGNAKKNKAAKAAAAKPEEAGAPADAESLLS